MELGDLAITVLSSSAVTGLGIFLTRTWMQAGINDYYTKKLSKFNEQITIQAEIRKQDIDKKFHDFTLYSTKRHDIYSELYKQIHKIYFEFAVINNLVIEAINSVSRNENVGVIFEELGQAYSLGEKAVNELKALEINKIKKEDLNAAIKQVKHIINKNAFTNLALKLKNTGDFFLENMLYFSQETLDLITNLLKDLQALLDDKVELCIGDFKGYLNYEDIEMKDKFHTIRYKEMDQTLIVLRELMRKELSISNE